MIEGNEETWDNPFDRYDIVPGKFTMLIAVLIPRIALISFSLTGTHYSGVGPVSKLWYFMIRVTICLTITQEKITKNCLMVTLLYSCIFWDLDVKGTASMN